MVVNLLLLLSNYRIERFINKGLFRNSIQKTQKFPGKRKEKEVGRPYFYILFVLFFGPFLKLDFREDRESVRFLRKII